jgi:hypothetical protein
MPEGKKVGTERGEGREASQSARSQEMAADKTPTATIHNSDGKENVSHSNSEGDKGFVKQDKSDVKRKVLGSRSNSDEGKSAAEETTRPMQRSAAAEDPDRIKINSDSLYFIDNGLSKTGAQEVKSLPPEFTQLNIRKSPELGIGFHTPVRTKKAVGQSSSRLAETTQSGLLVGLLDAIQQRETENAQLTKKHKNRGNLANAQLSIIPHDPNKQQLFINVNGDGSKYVTPAVLFGQYDSDEADTHANFFDLHKTYFCKEVQEREALQKLIQESKVKQSLEDKEIGRLLRQHTHHSEQFLMAAMKKSLLALQESKFEFDNATIILDIITQLAPCNHCVNRINDFLNEIRDEIFPGQNYLVARVSWLEAYNQGQSPSQISETYHQKTQERDSYLSEPIEISDTKKNYMFFCKVTPEMAQDHSKYSTPSGNSAVKASSVSSSSKSQEREDLSKIEMTFGSGLGFCISPPRQNPRPTQASVQNLRKEYDAMLLKGTGEAISVTASCLDFGPDEVDPVALERYEGSALVPPPIVRMQGWKTSKTSVTYGGFDYKGKGYNSTSFQDKVRQVKYNRREDDQGWTI